METGKDQSEKKYDEIISKTVDSIKSGAFNLDKIIPTEATFKLSIPTGENTFTEKTYTLKKFSLRAKKYFLDKYGNKDFVLKLNDAPEIMSAEIAFVLLTDEGKKDFKDLDDFMERFGYMGADMADMVSAVNKAMGFANQSPMTEADRVEGEPDGKKKE